MRQAISLILILSLGGVFMHARADYQGGWVGQRFRPEQCVEIKPGRFEFKRKLATVIYDIRPESGLFAVKGLLRFDKTFIPETVSHVELEVLLIDEAGVCTRQLNLRAQVEAYQASFVFKTDQPTSHLFVRTYYIIYYKQP